MRDLTIKRVGLDEMDDASTIHRTAFDDILTKNLSRSFSANRLLLCFLGLASLTLGYIESRLRR
jgi:hypothetical protein